MNLCYEVSSRLYQRKLRRAAPQAREADAASQAAAYWQEQFDSTARALAMFPELSLRDKTVLDIGCGIGGRTCYVATQPVKRVVGIDINRPEIETAKHLSRARLPRPASEVIEFRGSEESGATTDLGTFDVVFLHDTMEHVRDPVAILNYAYSVTNPGGVCYFSSIGWYHHRASHLNDLLPIPYLQVLFSDRTIIEAARELLAQPYYVPCQWDSDPPAARWRDVTDLRDRPGEYLNKISIRGMRTAMAASRFESSELFVHGFSERHRIARPVSAVLTRIPGLQELFHSYCVGRLCRERGTAAF